MKPVVRWLLWIGSGLTGGTGIIYWWMDHMIQPIGEWAVINHPLQPWVLKAHIVTAPLLIFAIGIIAVDHIWKHYRTGVSRGRRSGLSAMWVFAPMVVSGYLIQAVTLSTWLAFLVWVHLGTGLIYLIAFALHQVMVRIRSNGPRVEAPSRGLERSTQVPDPAPFSGSTRTPP